MMSIINSIKNIIRDKDHHWHKSNFLGNFINSFVACIVIPLAAFIFPITDSILKQNYELKKMKQESLIKFSQSITKTINYNHTMGDFYCKSVNESDAKKREEYLRLSDEYYDKFNSIDPQYEASCTILKLYFNDNIIPRIYKFEKLLDKLVSTEYKKIGDDKKCSVNGKFLELEDLVVDNYDDLINILLNDTK